MATKKADRHALREVPNAGNVKGTGKQTKQQTRESFRYSIGHGVGAGPGTQRTAGGPTLDQPITYVPGGVSRKPQIVKYAIKIPKQY